MRDECEDWHISAAHVGLYELSYLFTLSAGTVEHADYTSVEAEVIPTSKEYLKNYIEPLPSDGLILELWDVEYPHFIAIISRSTLTRSDNTLLGSHLRDK